MIEDIGLQHDEFARVMAYSQVNFRDAEDLYPLSPMQQGMLFDYLMATDSGVDIQQMGCDLGQGFLFSRPVPPEQLTTIGRNHPGALG